MENYAAYPFLVSQMFLSRWIQVKISIKGSLEMELGPNLAIFNLRIMYGMKRVIVFALKNNYELIVCKNRV